jgi:integrase
MDSVSKQAAQDFLGDRIADGKRGISPDTDKVFLDNLERLVVADLEKNQRASVDRAKRAYWHLKEQLATVHALQIPPILDEYIAERRRTVKATDGTVTKQGASAATVRQELRWLGRGYRLASEKGLLPFRPALPSIAVDNARQGFVTEEQLEKLVAELPEHMKAPTRFAFLTGWRKSEILSLRWTSIDLEAGTARVEASNSKTRRAREFPFRAMPDLESLVRDQKATTTAWEREHGAICPWVFHRNGRPIRDFYGGWRNACERAGLDVVLHDMRRSAIRRMEIAGVPRSTAMKLSGHRTESTYTRYAISAQADLEAGVAKIAALDASRARRKG